MSLPSAGSTAPQDTDFLLDVVVTSYQRRASQRAAINAMPLYPTEGLLWDTTQIPTAAYTGERPLALPKLNLQFLSPSDYLLRNFHLFRLEAAYEVREDIEVSFVQQHCMGLVQRWGLCWHKGGVRQGAVQLLR